MTLSDADNREFLRSRETFAFASALELLASTFIEEGDEHQSRVGALTKRIILPYVAYGTVLVADLELVEKELDERQESLMNDLSYARKVGLCIETDDVFTKEELDRANKAFYSPSDPFVGQFNAAFAAADFEHCAAVAELRTRQENATDDPNERSKLWYQKMQQVTTGMGLKDRKDYDRVDCPNEIRDLANHDLWMLIKKARANCMLFNLESDRLKLVALGKRPTVTHPKNDRLTKSKTNDLVKVLDVVLPQIALPRLERTKDLIDFIMMEEYRAPMRRLRSHCGQLVDGTQSLKEVSEAISDDLSELDRSIGKEKLTRYFGMCKFVFGATFGLAEDLIKLRLENLAKRPFEVAEAITEQYYYGPEYKKEPLYFLWALNDKFGE